MNITDCFQMRKRRSLDKTPGRSHDKTKAFPQSPVGKLRCTPRRLSRSNFNTSLSDQSLDIVWDNNSPSPTRTLSLGKRKKHYGSDSSSSGGEISDLVQKLADRSGQTPEPNPPLLALWMSRETNAASQKLNGNGTITGNNALPKKTKEFQTPSRRSRRVLRKCNKSKMKQLKQDIELLCKQLEQTDGEHAAQQEIVQQSSITTEQQQDGFTGIKQKETMESVSMFSETVDGNLLDGWDTEEDNEILSQVEIPCFKSNAPEMQIMTNTQLLDTGNDPGEKNNLTKSLLSKGLEETAKHVDNANDSIVTESWDFVEGLGNSDDTILESALEEFEKSQQVSVPTVRRVPLLHVKSEIFQNGISGCDSKSLASNLKTQTRTDVQRLQDTSSSLKRNSDVQLKCQWTASKTNFSFVPRSMLQSTAARSGTSTTAQEQRGTNSSTASNTGVQSTDKQRIYKNTDAQGNIDKQQERAEQRTTKGGTKPFKYSKEEIERKKTEALNRRRQKMAQSQRKNQNSRI